MSDEPAAGGALVPVQTQTVTFYGDAITGVLVQPGAPIFVLSPTRDARSAEYFFRKLLGDAHTVAPRVINVDGNAAYPTAFTTLQAEGALEPECELRPVKYLNTSVEQDHRFIKRRVKPGLGFAWYRTAWATLQGYEAMNQLRKGQVQGTTKGDILSQNRFSAAAFGVAA